MPSAKSGTAGFNPELPADEEQPKLVRVDISCLGATEGDANLASTAAEQPSISTVQSQAIRLQYGGGTLEIPEGASAEAIAEVLKALTLNAV